MRFEKSIKTNSIIYMIRNVMNIIFPLLTFKYAAIVIKANGVGANNYSSAIISYFGLIAQLGINTYAIAEGSKLRNSKEKFEKFVSNMFTLNFVSTVVAYLCLAFTITMLSELEEYRILLIIYSLTILSATIGMEWLFIILERFTYITVRSVIFQIISLVMLFMFVKDESDVVWYACLNVFASSGSSILNFIYANRIVKLRISKLSEIGKYLKPVLIIWISNVASLIYINADTIIVGILKGDYDVGVYSAAAKIIKAICVPITTICTVAAPSLAECIENNRNGINGMVQKIVDFLAFFIFPSLIGIYLLSDEAILILSGVDFLPGSSAVKILALDIFLSPVNGFLVSQILIPARKEKVSMFAMLLAAIGNILLDILLIPFLGINGAAIATVLSEMIVLIVCMRCVKGIIKVSDVCNHIVFFLASSLIVIPVYFFVKCFNLNYIVFSIITVLVSGILYLTLLKVFSPKMRTLDIESKH